MAYAYETPDQTRRAPTGVQGPTFTSVSRSKGVASNTAIVLPTIGTEQQMFEVSVSFAVLSPTVSFATTSEPLIAGTNIPVFRISALLDGGLTVKQVKEDFPSLSEAQIIQARDYARTVPNVWKQYPQKSLKRLLRQSGFAELEELLRE